MRQAVKSAHDREQVRTARKQDKLRRMAELREIKAIAALPDRMGLNFFRRYLQDCGVFQSSYAGNDTFFLEGMRYVGLQLLADINDADPRIYVEMVHMNKDEEEQEDGRRNQGRDDDE